MDNLVWSLSRWPLTLTTYCVSIPRISLLHSLIFLTVLIHHILGRHVRRLSSFHFLGLGCGLPGVLDRILVRSHFSNRLRVWNISYFTYSSIHIPIFIIQRFSLVFLNNVLILVFSLGNGNYIAKATNYRGKHHIQLYPS